MIPVTERSKAPAAISTVIPAAPIPTIDIWASTDSRFPESKKRGLTTASAIKIATLRIQIPLREGSMRSRDNARAPSRAEGSVGSGLPWALDDKHPLP
jgi:hypothetical protein